MSRPAKAGNLFVVVAPSGAGKTTLVDALLKREPNIRLSPSYTTRAPREGEKDGVDYFFISRPKFEEMIAAGEFLEHANVHGRHYGTLKQTVIDQLIHGVDVLIDIDTQGAANIRACNDPFIQGALADVFIMPPSLEELRRRLTRRGTETPEQIEIRITNAATEMERWRDYRYTLISGSMEEDIEKFRAVMRAERYLSRRLIHHAA